MAQDLHRHTHVPRAPAVAVQGARDHGVFRAQICSVFADRI